MKPRASKLKWCISLAVVACVIFAAVGAFAQNAQGLAAVGAIDPANGYPRWYLDKTACSSGNALTRRTLQIRARSWEHFPIPGSRSRFPITSPTNSSTGARRAPSTTLAMSEAGRSW